MPDKMQIRHIAIRSEDPDQLSSFCEKTFGLRVVRKNPRGNKNSIYMTDGYMHLAINANSGNQPNVITPLHQGESAPGRHTENYILDPQGNRIDVVLDMWPT